MCECSVQIFKQNLSNASDIPTVHRSERLLLQNNAISVLV